MVIWRDEIDWGGGGWSVVKRLEWSSLGGEEG